MSEQDDASDLVDVLVSRYSASMGGEHAVDLLQARKVVNDIVNDNESCITLHVTHKNKVQEHHIEISPLPLATTSEGRAAREETGRYVDELVTRYLDEIESLGAVPESDVILSAIKLQVLREAKALALTKDWFTGDILFPFHRKTLNALSFITPNIRFCGVSVVIDRPSEKSLTVTTSKFMVWYLDKDRI